MKRAIPVLVLALIAAMGQSNVVASAAPTSSPNDHSVSERSTTSPRNGAKTLYVNGAIGDDQLYNCLADDTSSSIADQGPCKTLQGAINKSSDDDTIRLEPGDFTLTATITINRGVAIVGTVGASGESLTNLLVSGSVTALTIQDDSVRLENLSVRRAPNQAVAYGNGVEISGARNNLRISNVSIQGANNALRIGTDAGVNGLAVTGSHFDTSVMGWYVATGVNNGSVFKNVHVSNSTFSGNQEKGIYVEKLSDAVFDGITVANSGTDSVYNVNNGIDINLKYQAYKNITIKNSSITNSGFYGTAPSAIFPAAVTIKARDDAPDYNSNPATLTGVTIENTIIQGPENALRLGEAGKINKGPTNVRITDSFLVGDDSSGNTGYGLINVTDDTTSARGNWWGSSDDSVIAATISGTSKVDFSTYLSTSSDSVTSVPGFESDKSQLGVTARGAHIGQTGRITGALQIVNGGGTVRVSPGVYDENVVIDDTPVNLVGPYADKSPWAFGTETLQWGSESTRAIVRGSSVGLGVISLGESTQDARKANGSSVKGLEITVKPGGPLTQSGISARYEELERITLANNYIHDTTAQGIDLNLGETGTPRLYLKDFQISGNLIADLSGDDSTGINAWTQSGLKLLSNKVSNVGRGIQVSRLSGSSLIASNVVQDVDLSGISVAREVDDSLSIRGNDLLRVNLKGQAPPTVSTGAIRLHDTLQLTGTVDMSNNQIDNSKTASSGSGIAILAPTVASSIPFDQIRIAGNSIDVPPAAKRLAVRLKSSQQVSTLIAESNLWGDDTTLSEVSGGIFVNDDTVSVDFNPWIINYADDPARVGQPGFWPIIQKAEADTPIGTNVDDTFTGFPNSGEVKLTFAQVDDTGLTTVTAFQGDDTTPFPTIPSGFTLGTPPVYYTITSEAGRPAGSTVRVCLTFPAGSFAPDVDPIMFHFTGGVWVSLDTTVVGSTACASVTSFSPFALGVPILPPPPPAPVFPPSPPRDLAGTGGDAQISATWMAPVDPGTFPVTSYQVEALPGSASCLVEAPALSCTIAGVSNGTEYTLRARALNGAGWSAWSDASAPVVPGSAAPGAPTNVTAVAGNSEATVTWTAPTSTGTSPITGYRIEQSRAGGAWIVAIADTGSAETIATVTGLINGDSYRFRVAAINGSGAGVVSLPSAAVTPEDPERTTILITGERSTVKGKSGIRVEGESTGLSEGAILRPWIRFPGQTTFTRGGARIIVAADGSFAWQRKTGKKVTVYIQAGDGTRSNRVTIPAR